ncbi:MAG TPA: ATP-dependent DNA helicase [Frankiaceae bacterium]|nr:ATP-dependent DNA helicase [Frankiaceae bacterium]
MSTVADLGAPAYRLVRTAPPPPFVPDLDDAQDRVVTHAGGPLLVLAGPGTGKTTTLVEAVVNRVDRGLDPEQVLVLTFSRKAADELRGRITARLGRTVTSPAAWTFHSFCFALVRAYAFPGEDPPRLLSGAERDVRVRELLAGNADGVGTAWPESLRPALRTLGFAREVADLLDRARERGLSGPDLTHLGFATGRDAWVTTGEFMEEYLDVLDLRGEVDYAGLVSRARGVLSDPEALAEVRARYAAVFVDEYQDTDPSQEALLQLLAGDGRDLVVVGDPDQSIYAFRGADVSGILEFPTRFPTPSGERAPTVTLRVSRRAGAALLAPSRAVAARLPAPGLPADVVRAHRDLVPAAGLSVGDATPDGAGNGDSAPDSLGGADSAPDGTGGGVPAPDGPTPGGPAPEICLFPTVAEEVAAIADRLRRAHLYDGLPWSSMAVLVRCGVRSIPVLRRAFAQAGVPVGVAADEVPVARDPAVAPLLAALRVVDDPAALDADTAHLLLLSPLANALPSGLRVLGRRLRALARAAGETFPPPSTELIRAALADRRDLSTIEDWAADPVRRLGRLLDKARAALDAGGTPEEALWTLWHDSGWARRLERAATSGGNGARQADRDLDAVLALFNAAARLEEREPRAGVTTLLGELEAQQLPASAHEERPAAADTVRLLTAHRSKGLEWDLVVVAGVQDGIWPDLRRSSSLLDADLVGTHGPRPPVTPAQLLADERRLFYVALTRARRRLVVTAVQSLDDAGDRPSRFLDELGIPVPTVAALAGTELLARGSLVARLRRAVREQEPPLAAAAARRLAALAALADADGAPLFPGADPEAWWGVRDRTPGAAPLRDPELPLVLSPSALKAFEECPLRWFLEREARARGAQGAAQGFGVVVHALAQLVSDGVLPPDRDALLARLDTVWPSLGFEAPWHGAAERREAEQTIDRLLAWLRNRGDRAFVAAEASFTAELGGVVLRGSADRLEVDADGHVHVVDFKTGRTPVSTAAAAEDAQLGAYQLAVRAGGFETLPGDAAAGGAELVYLRKGTAAGLPTTRRQPALPDAETFMDELVAHTERAVRAEEFPARPNERCGSCDFRGACPAQAAGRQVVP